MNCFMFIILIIFIAVSGNQTKQEFQCIDRSRVDTKLVCNGVMDCDDGTDEMPALCKFITCPTYMFRCNYGACTMKSYKCDGKIDCVDKSDESHCGHESGNCNVTEFLCGSGECVNSRLLCNGKADCIDKSDESSDTCEDFPCPAYTFQCDYGGCIAQAHKCNGITDCLDGSDEFRSHCPQNCGKKICKERKGCLSNEFRCHSGQCVSRHVFCDGQVDCDDGSDETPSACSSINCPAHMFRCMYGACISMNLTCNGVPQCADWSDEDPKLCGHNLAPGSCYLPNPSPYVQYKAKNCHNCLPGALVAEYEVLNFTCELGHKLQGSSSVYCHHSMWMPQLPTCIPAGNEVTCSPVNSSHISMTCESEVGSRKIVLPCDKPLPIGTVIQYQCLPYYVPKEKSHQDNTHNECQKDGSWSNDILECVPECGKINEEAVPLVVNGHDIKYGLWPWQVGMFHLQAGNWTFWCGGNLVNEYAVVTAAHCTWELKAEEFRVVLGKHYREFNRNEELTQVKSVKAIIMQPAYQDKTGNYGSDVAVLILSTPAEFSESVRPVCIDWDFQYIDKDLSEGSMGTVAGWGVNENETFSDSLKMVELPVIDDRTCIKEHSRDFKKYVTYTTFCAGYNNGTGVCNGDSGGGLIFPHPDNNDTWVLQGLVSVSPRKLGTSFCDPTKYTIFTKVAMYTKWLKSVLGLQITK